MAIEFAIISVALVLLSLGTIEFGRALEVRHRLSFAADIGSRLILNDSEVADADVEETLRSTFEAANPDLLQVELGTETIDGTDFRTVSISYPFTFIIPQLSSESIVLSADERVPVT